MFLAESAKDLWQEHLTWFKTNNNANNDFLDAEDAAAKGPKRYCIPVAKQLTWTFICAGAEAGFSLKVAALCDDSSAALGSMTHFYSRHMFGFSWYLST